MQTLEVSGAVRPLIVVVRRQRVNYFLPKKQRIQVHLCRSSGRLTVWSAVLPPVHESHVPVFSNSIDTYWGNFR